MDRKSFKKFAFFSRKVLKSDACEVFIPVIAMRILQVRGLASPYIFKNSYSLNAAADSLKEYIPYILKDVSFSKEIFSNGFIERLLEIPESEFVENPNVIGWLYQYYEAAQEPAVPLRRSKHHGDEISASTRLFTPEWIAGYMAENGLENIDISYENIHEIKVIDVCMGSGNILVSVFEKLMQIYESMGKAYEEAVVCILEKNIYGFDIDSYVCEIAKFTLLMKAIEYAPGIFYRHINFNIYSHGGISELESYGSAYIAYDTENEVLKMLSQKYDLVITNPPYLSRRNMNRSLLEYTKKYYPDSKYDMSAVFISRCIDMTRQGGCTAMLVPHSFMFLSSFGKLRAGLLEYDFISMLHLGAGAFENDVGTIVQTCSFIIRKSHSGSKCTYFDLTNYATSEEKRIAFENRACRIYSAASTDFAQIKGSPMAYWADRRYIDIFRENVNLGSMFKAYQGLTTSDNKRFIKYWFEVPKSEIAFGCNDSVSAKETGKIWFPYNKGGKFRKWYGNNYYIINYFNDGQELKDFHKKLNRTSSGGRLKNKSQYFKEGVTWQYITYNSQFGVRYQPKGFLFDVAGSCIFPDEKYRLYLMGLMNSKVCTEILKILNPTLNFQPENIAGIPIIFNESYLEEINYLSAENIAISKENWDLSELSWDFDLPILIKYKTNSGNLKDAFENYLRYAERSFKRLKSNEIRLNEIFIKIYGLEGKISPEIHDKNITYTFSDMKSEIDTLISYMLGCIFGRFELKGFDIRKNIVSKDDIYSYLYEFMAVTFGKESISENMRQISLCISESDENPTAIENYIFKGFIKSHTAKYKKCPLYILTEDKKHIIYKF